MCCFRVLTIPRIMNIMKWLKNCEWLEKSKYYLINYLAIDEISFSFARDCFNIWKNEIFWLLINLLTKWHLRIVLKMKKMMIYKSMLMFEWYFKHFFLMKIIFIIVFDKEYSKQFRQWFFFSSYAWLQLFFHHFKNYSLAEHARWSIIISAFLRFWFRKKHVQSLFMHKFKQLFNCSNTTVINIIVKCFAAMTMSNNVLMIDDLTKNRQHFGVFVRNFRQQYQQLLIVAAFAFDANSRSRFKTFVEKNFNSISFSQQINWIESLTLTQRQIQLTVVDNTEKWSICVNQYRNDTKRSNVHAGVHFERIIDEYDFFSNCNVLIDENKHRYFKKIVYYINHFNIEKTMLFCENLR